MVAKKISEGMKWRGHNENKDSLSERAEKCKEAFDENS